MSRRSKNKVIEVAAGFLGAKGDYSAEQSRWDAQLAATKAEVASTKKELEQILNLLEEASTRLGQKESSYNRLSTEYQTLYSEFTSYVKSTKVEKSELEAELAKLSGLLEKLTIEKATLQKAIVLQKEELAALRKEAEQAITEKEATEKRAEEIVLETSSKLKSIEETATSGLKDIETRKTELLATTAKLNKDKEKLEQILSKLMQQEKTAISSLAAVSDDLLQAKNDFAYLVAELEDIKRQLAEKKELFETNKQLAVQTEVKSAKLKEYAKFLKEKYAYLGVNVEIDL